MRMEMHETRAPYPLRRGARLSGAHAVYVEATNDLRDEMREHFIVIALDVRHRIVSKRTIAIGSLSGVEVHPREVFKPAILDSAAAIIMVHNHPSGDPNPSRSDVELTARLRQVGDLVGIPVLDHVVIGTEGYVSMAERGWS